jgi:hypothetical protein
MEMLFLVHVFLPRRQSTGDCYNADDQRSLGIKASGISVCLLRTVEFYAEDPSVACFDQASLFLSSPFIPLEQSTAS